MREGHIAEIEAVPCPEEVCCFEGSGERVVEIRKNRTAVLGRGGRRTEHNVAPIPAVPVRTLHSSERERKRCVRGRGRAPGAGIDCLYCGFISNVGAEATLTQGSRWKKSNSGSVRTWNPNPLDQGQRFRR